MPIENPSPIEIFKMPPQERTIAPKTVSQNLLIEISTGE